MTRPGGPRAARLAAGLALAGCAAATPPAEGPDPAAAEAACAAATAAHVGKPVAAMTAAWQGASPDGGGTVAVTDGAATAAERVHTCVVRADGSLAALAHATL